MSSSTQRSRNTLASFRKPTTTRSEKKRIPVKCKRGKKARFSGTTVVKRTEWDNLDVSTYKVTFSSSLLLELQEKNDSRRIVTIDQENSFQKGHNGSNINKRSKSMRKDERRASGKSAKQLAMPSMEREFASISRPSKKAKIFALTRQLPDTEELIKNLIQRPSPPRSADQVGPIVARPHDHDVLLGRGNGTRGHPGNLAYRMFCWNARDDYTAALRHNKPAVVESVVQQVLERKPPGRFLEFEHAKGYFVDVPLDRIRCKIGQALRERKWTPPLDLPQKLQEATERRHPLPSHQAEVVPCQKVIAPTIEMPIVALANPPQRKPDAINLVDAIIGPQSRLAVYWPLDDAFYKATVVERMQNCVFLRYDDDDTEWLDLTKNTFQVLGKAISSSPPALQTSMANNMVHA